VCVLNKTYLFWLLVFAIISCSNRNTFSSLETQNSASSRAEPKSAKFGSIRGKAFSCRNDSPIPFARIILYAMPDSLDPESEHHGEMRLYTEEGSLRSTNADSMGVFRIDNLPCDYYQIVVWGEKPSILGMPVCGTSAIDFVRVASDSISLVDIRQINQIIQVTHWARKWEPHYDTQ